MIQAGNGLTFENQVVVRDYNYDAGIFERDYYRIYNHQSEHILYNFNNKAVWKQGYGQWLL